MDYVKPQDIVKGMLSTAEVKLNLPVHQLLMRGALAGGFLRGCYKSSGRRSR